MVVLGGLVVDPGEVVEPAVVELEVVLGGSVVVVVGGSVPHLMRRSTIFLFW